MKEGLTVFMLMLLAALMLGAVGAYWGWVRWDGERREQRLVHRNLNRGGLL